MRLDPRVDHQWAAAAPMFIVDECARSFNVGGWIRSGEGHPEQVPQTLRSECAVIDNHDEGESADGIVGTEGVAAGGHVGAIAIGRALDDENSWQCDPRVTKAVG